jgi:hypothetical protein
MFVVSPSLQSIDILVESILKSRTYPRLRDKIILTAWAKYSYTVLKITFQTILGMEEIFLFPVFSCENELIPIKFVYNFSEVLAFLKGALDH